MMKNHWNNFRKRLLAAFMASAMALSFAGCGTEKTQVSDPAPEETEALLAEESDATQEEENENLIPAEDSRYEAFQPMESTIGGIAEYLHILNDYNTDDLSADDFWDLISIVTTQQIGTDGADRYGIYHVSKDLVWEYADTFFRDYLEQGGLPSWSDSYSASASESGNGVDLMPLTVENYTHIIDRLENDADGGFIAVVHLASSGGDGDSPIYVVNVHLTEWGDGSSHIFPFRVTDFEKGETIEPAVTAEPDGSGSDVSDAEADTAAIFEESPAEP